MVWYLGPCVKIKKKKKSFIKFPRILCLENVTCIFDFKNCQGWTTWICIIEISYDILVTGGKFMIFDIEGHSIKYNYLSAKFLDTVVNRFLESSFQISSGFSWELSNIWRQASTDFFMASKKISGKNFDRAILTLGPINLSEDILQRTSAAFSLTAWSWALQNKYTKVITPPEKCKKYM